MVKLSMAALAAGMVWSSAASATVIWADSFESGDFSKWSYVQGADPAQRGPGPKYVFVTTAMNGVQPEDGQYMAHFERPASAPNLPMAKVFKEWSDVGKKDQFHRVEDPVFNNGDPSGVYSAWFYIPAGYTVGHEWVNIMQFKEEGTDASGSHSQNPSWWVNLSACAAWQQGGKEPCLFINNWGNKAANRPGNITPAPIGRWFQVKAKLYQGDHIDWYVDGKPFDTSKNSTYPVGRFYAKPEGWIFGVGHYMGTGVIYVDNVKVETLQ